MDAYSVPNEQVEYVQMTARVLPNTCGIGIMFLSTDWAQVFEVLIDVVLPHHAHDVESRPIMKFAQTPRSIKTGVEVKFSRTIRFSPDEIKPTVDEVLVGLPQMPVPSWFKRRKQVQTKPFRPTQILWLALVRVDKVVLHMT